MNTAEEPDPGWQPIQPLTAMQRVARVLNDTAGFEVSAIDHNVREQLLSRIVQAVADPVTAPPRIGQIVRLNSGGCTMTLIDIDHTNTADDPDCTVVWTTVDGQGGQLVVPRSCLVKVDQAAEEAELAPLRRPPPTRVPGPGVTR